MQIRICTKIIKEMQSKWKFASSIRCHDGCSTFNSLYLSFARCMHPVDASSIDASSSKMQVFTTIDQRYVIFIP